MKKFLLILLLPCFLKAQTTRTIASFGGVGDGVFDNYYVFKVAAAYATTHPNLTITFPSGVFYIDKYRTKQNDTTDHIKWKDCIGLKLIGSAGTVISMNGNFFRPLDHFTSECAKKSYTTGLCPFQFDNCKNLEVRNMEVTGNVNLTTRAPGVDVNNPSVTEGSGTMLDFTKCDTVVVDNLYLHHAESDGITVSGDRIGGVWIPSDNFNISNVRSWNNGRQGMSVGSLTNGYFYKCSFSNTGFTGGTYGHNDPAAGVDIEPGADHYNMNIVFDSCYFIGNYGAQLNLSYPTTSSYITLLKCVFSGQGNEKTQGITMLAYHSLVDSCFLSMGDRDFKITNSAKPGATITMSHNTIESIGTWINTNSSNMLDTVVISNNQITYLPSSMAASFVILQTKNLRLLNNTFNISPAALASKPTGNHVVVENAIISSGNIFPVGTRVSYAGTLTVADP